MRRGPGRRSATLLLLTTVAIACAHDPDCTAQPEGAGGSGPVVDTLLLGHRSTLPVATLVERGRLDPGQDVRVEELGRDQDTSHHLVTLRDREPLHRHDRHALVVILLEGHGTMHLAGEERAVAEGSVLHVPRGAVHAFINRSEQPAVAYIVYAPPYDGSDRQLVE